MQNYQRDGLRQMQVPNGRVNYESNSVEGTPRENPTRGFTSYAEPMDGVKERRRSETFANHYSQARMFFRSMLPREQAHIISAFAFEWAHVERKAIRLRMLGHLANIDSDLHAGVTAALGMSDPAEKITPAVTPRDLPPSPALSIMAKAKPTLEGRKLGVLLTDGFDARLLTKLRASAKAEKAALAVIAPKVGGVKDSDGKLVEADFPLSSAPGLSQTPASLHSRMTSPWAPSSRRRKRVASGRVRNPSAVLDNGGGITRRGGTCPSTHE